MGPLQLGLFWDSVEDKTHPLEVGEGRETSGKKSFPLILGVYPT